MTIGRRLLLLAVVFVFEREHLGDEDAKADEEADYLETCFEGAVSVFGVVGVTGAGAAAAMAVVAAVLGLGV
jgi:hypothetical protein